jgi:hypothetical protein
MFKWTSRFRSEVHPCTTMVLIYLSESGTQGLEVLVMTTRRFILRLRMSSSRSRLTLQATMFDQIMMLSKGWILRLDSFGVLSTGKGAVGGAYYDAE